MPLIKNNAVLLVGDLEDVTHRELVSNTHTHRQTPQPQDMISSALVAEKKSRSKSPDNAVKEHCAVSTLFSLSHLVAQGNRKNLAGVAGRAVCGTRAQSKRVCVGVGSSSPTYADSVLLPQNCCQHACSKTSQQQGPHLIEASKLEINTNGSFLKV